MLATAGVLAAQPGFADSTQVSVGSTVWLDINYNGRHDPGEPTIPGVLVELIDQSNQTVATRTTDDQGNYRFADLAPGTYRLRIPQSQLTGLAGATGTAGPVAAAVRGYWGTHGVSTTIPIKALSTRDLSVTASDGNRVDGDGDGAQSLVYGYGYGTDAVSPEITLTVGGEPRNASNGERQQTAGNQGYKLDEAEDANGDMTVDFGFAHQCATICDIDRDGKVTASDITAIGKRLLTSVTPGAPGSGNCSGSGVISGDDRLWCQAFVDYAPVVKVALGNQVYEELNGNPGYQPDGGDLPLSGVTVALYKDGQATGKTAVTGSDGCYLFDNLDSGNYYAALPASQFAAGGGLFGLRAASGAGNNAIGDDDVDHNGVQSVSRGDVRSNAVALTPGTQPTFERPTACTSALPDANTNLTVDFALEPELGIGNRVWKEVNGTPGYQPEDRDLAIPDVTVELYDDSNNPVLDSNGQPRQAVTNADGCYLIEGLRPGNYVARIVPGADNPALAGLEPAADAGEDETTDDAADHNGFQGEPGAPIETNVFTLAPGGQPTGEASRLSCRLATLPDANVNETADFAFSEPVSPNRETATKVAIGNLVWIDRDNTRGFGSGDLPQANVDVELLDESRHVIASAKTDDNGCYLFEDQPEGTYYVQIPARNFGVGGALAGYGPLADSEGEGDGGLVSAFGDNPAIDDDKDQNGRVERINAGVTGNVISNLFTLAVGQQPTGEQGQACAALASHLPDANVNQTADFAFEAKVAIGNLVWIDRNGVAGFQPGDQPASGIKVELYSAATNKVVAKTTTGDDGFYLFDELSPGRYYVFIPSDQFSESGPGPLYGNISFADAAPPAGDDATDDVADENGLDEDYPELNGVRSATFDLEPGGEPTQEQGRASAATGLVSRLPDANVNLTADFAFAPKPVASSELVYLSIGSTVWIDINWNGIRDADEPGVKGVTVTLTGGGLSSPLTSVTDDNGNYQFTNLVAADDYKVSIAASEMAAGKPLGVALANYFATKVTLGLPTSIPVKPLSSKILATSSSDNQVAGDNNGLQAGGYGTAVESPMIALTGGLEPVDGSSLHTEQGLGSAQDNAADANGDMTVDFGFIHNCATICDVTGVSGSIPDGQVTKADTDAILVISKNAKRRVVSPGAPHSGDCAQTGIVTGNDAAWCKAFRRDL